MTIFVTHATVSINRHEMEIEFLNANVMDTTLLLGSTGIFDTSSDGQL